MSDLPTTWPGYIQTQETQFNSAASYHLAQKNGEGLNSIYAYLASLASTLFTVKTFLSSDTFLIPATVSQVILFGSGAGGGGAGGASGVTGGCGGNSAIPFMTTVSVTPSSTAVISIGAGGLGGGANGIGGNGANTTFGTITDGTLYKFGGAKGGLISSLPSLPVIDSAIIGPGGHGSSAGTPTDGTAWFGNPGGAAGVSTGPFGDGRGGGGASSWLVGGAGASYGGSGSSAAANSGAGGGGGGSSGSGGGVTTANPGGNGGSGRLYVIYFS